MSSNNINNIIKGPILTEKSYQLMSESVYSFKVSPKTNRSETKKAIEYIFNVKVAKVNLFNVPKKAKRVGKSKGFVPAYKKAFVKLAPGFSINLFNDETPSKDQDDLQSNRKAEIEQKKTEYEQKSKEIYEKVAKKFANSNKENVESTENQASDFAETALKPAAPSEKKQETKTELAQPEKTENSEKGN
ncbi:50S ribosomal protein L23 [Mycoplasma sp. 'Moose RK']|uniref:50S ribosomal protein L23 n=1 Tax=Mycoplasma sp. 'Moose RK' TaxID=2780095 RepID=UPI0018C27153|nr:50S ribosomal protein L23 [Mycoplasma sp. 'Moose RK']MBG0730827.1 50S ribosomal protein L23 [Mycoplasma sp. 'Moose RK']